MVGSPMYKDTWYRELDRFAVLPLVSVSAVLAIICTARYTFFEVSWTFSIILESVAILPQLHHLTLVPTLPALPLSHLVALGLYRFFYVVNWVFRLAFDSDATSSGGWDNTAFIFGVIQTLVWADFMWVWYNRKQIKLPGVSTSVEDGRGAVDGEGSAVDEGDMAKSLVLQNLFKAAVWADNKVLGGRARVHQQLSVSAYPDHQVRIERGAGGAYSDDVPPVNEPAAPQTSPPAPVTVPASATVPAPFSPPAGIKDPWKSGDASIKAQSATSKPTGSSTAETSTTAKTTKQDDFDVE
ncbi:endoplasmic reticulum retention protein [Savitreella phatthalungensis]